MKSWCKVEWYLKRISNIIQIINDYRDENWYDLSVQTHFMVKCDLYQNNTWKWKNISYIDKQVVEKSTQTTNNFF